MYKKFESRYLGFSASGLTVQHYNRSHCIAGLEFSVRSYLKPEKEVLPVFRPSYVISYFRFVVQHSYNSSILGNLISDTSG